MWPMWEAVAPTMAYDAAIMGEDASVPTERAATVAVPALIMDGEVSYPFMHVTATALANAIPNAQHRTLEGQTHEVAPETGPSTDRVLHRVRVQQTEMTDNWMAL